MSDKAVELKKLLEAIFEDSLVEPKEREALSEFTKSLSREESGAVFAAFFREKWGEAMADGVLTAVERALLVKIVHELELGPDDLAPQMRQALKEHL